VSTIETNYQVLAFELMATLSLSKYGRDNIIFKVINLSQLIGKLATLTIVSQTEHVQMQAPNLAKVCLLSRLLANEKTESMQGLDSAYESCISILINVLACCDVHSEEIFEDLVALNQLELAIDSVAYLMLKA